MRSFLLTSLLLCLTAGAAIAQPGADPAPAPSPPADEPSRGERIAAATFDELKRTEKVKHKGPLVSLHAGYHGDVAGMAELRLGFGTGSATESLLFPTTRLWRFSAAARGAYGRHDSLALSLLAGYSRITLIGFSLEAGVDARVIGDGDAAFGPIASLGIRLGKMGLHTNVWAHMVDPETDYGFSIALGMNLKDTISASDVAKKRVRAKVEAELPSGLKLP